jgi:plastocyanin
MRPVITIAALSLLGSSSYAAAFCMNNYHPSNAAYPPPWAGHHPYAGMDYRSPAAMNRQYPYSAMQRPMYRPYTPATPPASVAPAAAVNTVASTDTTADAATDVAVRIQGMRFEPAVITIEPGTRVNWMQSDGAPHTVKSDSGMFDSSVLQNGQGHTFTFSEPGIYKYRCSIHPSMRGTVVVKSPAT